MKFNEDNWEPLALGPTEKYLGKQRFSHRKVKKVKYKMEEGMQEGEEMQIVKNKCLCSVTSL